MTLHAARDGGNVVLSCGYGPVKFRIAVHPSHAGYFWHELGNLLSEEEKRVPRTVTVDLPGGEDRENP